MEINNQNLSQSQKLFGNESHQDSPSSKIIEADKKYYRSKRIFVLLHGLYSNKFSASIQNEEVYLASLAIWDNALKDISNEIIKRAIDDLTNKFPSWPPTPGEFKGLCLSYEGSKRFKFKDDVLALPENKTSYKSSNESVTRIIDEGAKVCKKLMKIYPDNSYMEIGNKFTRIKMMGRSYYPGIPEIEMIRKLVDLSEDEIKEILLDKFI